MSPKPMERNATEGREGTAELPGQVVVTTPTSVKSATLHSTISPALPPEEGDMRATIPHLRTRLNATR
jgi:hypothetical protein